MSTQLVSECAPLAYQDIKATKNSNIVAIRPHLYIHNAPAGNIKVQVKDANNRLITESAAILISDLITQANIVEPYAHGYFRFYVNVPFIEDQYYRLVVVCGGGYSFSESAYIGVCLDWDNTKIQLAYTPINSFQSPLDFELWERLNT